MTDDEVKRTILQFQKEHKELTNALEETWDVLHELQVAHARVLQSKSWQFTVFFRMIGRFLRGNNKRKEQSSLARP